MYMMKNMHVYDDDSDDKCEVVVVDDNDSDIDDNDDDSYGAKIFFILLTTSGADLAAKVRYLIENDHLAQQIAKNGNYMI